MSKGMGWLDITAITLLIVGGINWGLVGFSQWNLVSWLNTVLGIGIWFSRLIYALVGVAAVWSLLKFVGWLPKFLDD